ncbi:MAG: hypothetical protein HY905_18350 [Deltaproteobacteria bacterium]|nr:hypothetical protein [Deltaproteobacteria bacterium]
MRRVVALSLLLAVLPGLGCPEYPVCDPSPSDNTCSGDGDCTLAYCATQCCFCPRAYSRAQVDSTWCLTTYGSVTPIAECLTGRDTRCAGGPPCVCAYDVEAWCNAGKCDLRATTP